MHKVLWTVSLSNGETFYEEKGNFKTIEGELSPWQRLLAYIVEKQLNITSLSLYTNDGRRWNIPSTPTKDSAPRFRQLEGMQRPHSHKFYRKMAGEVNQVTGEVTKQEHYHVIEAGFKHHNIQVWVNDEGTVSWSLIINN